MIQNQIFGLNVVKQDLSVEDKNFGEDKFGQLNAKN